LEEEIEILMEIGTLNDKLETSFSQWFRYTCQYSLRHQLNDEAGFIINRPEMIWSLVEEYFFRSQKEEKWKWFLKMLPISTTDWKSSFVFFLFGIAIEALFKLHFSV
jgi:hypothetical protein